MSFRRSGIVGTLQKIVDGNIEIIRKTNERRIVRFASARTTVRDASYALPEEDENRGFELVGSSRNEMIDMLNAAEKHNRLMLGLRTVFLVLCVFAFALTCSFLSNAQEKFSYVGWGVFTLILSAGLLVTGLVAFKEHSITLDYSNRDGLAEHSEYEEHFAKLNAGLESLSSCERLFELTSLSPLKYRDIEFVPLEKYIDTDTDIKEIKAGNAKIMFLPDMLAIFGDGYWTGATYGNCRCESGNCKIKHDEEVGDATFIRYAYEHETKSGAPDKRYADNKTYYMYSYGALTLNSDKGAGINVIGSCEAKTSEFCAAFNDYVSFVSGRK